MSQDIEFRVARDQRVSKLEARIDAMIEINAELMGQLAAKWISTDERLPEFDSRVDSFGVPVLVWPRDTLGEGDSETPVAFYGMRYAERTKPVFYMYGRVVRVVHGITHWQPLPDGPIAAPPAGESLGVKK